MAILGSRRPRAERLGLQMHPGTAIIYKILGF